MSHAPRPEAATAGTERSPRRARGGGSGHPAWRLLGWVVRTTLRLLLVAGLAGGTAYGVLQWRMAGLEAGRDQVLYGRMREDLARLSARVNAVDARLRSLEGVAFATGGMGEDGPASLAELRRELADLRRATESRLARLEAMNQVTDGPGDPPDGGPANGDQAEPAPPLPGQRPVVDVRDTEAGTLLALQNALVKARVELADGNLGRARRELRNAVALAARGAETTRAPGGEEWWRAQAATLERVRLELGLETPTAGDRFELLWHRLHARWLGTWEEWLDETAPEALPQRP